MNGLILRSKANIVENSEKNSKYFASLEKKRSESKTISRLLFNDNNNTDQKKILQEAESYKKLYDKKETLNLRINFFDDSIKNLMKQKNKHARVSSQNWNVQKHLKVCRITKALGPMV